MNELMTIPTGADVPDFIRDPENARLANEDAACGISTGMPPRIKLNGKSFSLIDGNGDEKPMSIQEMTQGPDGNLHLPVVVLRARKALNKSFYASAYNPNTDAQAPDCFSSDGIRPDAGSLVKQAETCAVCPQNAFGSGKDQMGNPTKGKACADTKILAAFVPKHGIHMLRIPPASLKMFGTFVKQISGAGIPLGSIYTLISFDQTASFPVLVFNFGGFIKDEGARDQLAVLAQSVEALEIIDFAPVPQSSASLPAPVQTPPVQQEPQAQPVQAQPVQAQPVQQEPQAQPVQAQPVQAQPVQAQPVQQEPQAQPVQTQPVQTQPVQQEPQAQPEQVGAGVTDDALRAALGL